MARFFFDIHVGPYLISDDEGQELPNAEAARNEALKVLPEIARDRLPNEHQRDFTCDVRDESGQVIYTVTLSVSSFRPLRSAVH